MDRDTTLCIVCFRPLWADEIEAGRYTGLDCQRQAVDKLRQLPRLYRATEYVLQPGRRGDSGGRVTGSKHAPLPCREDVLDLRAGGGMAGELAQWEDCIREELGFDPRPGHGSLERTLAATVDFLTQNAPWIWSSFLAVDDLHRDIARWHGVARRLVEGEQRERQIPVVCTAGTATGPCGQVLRISMSADGRRCACGTQYGWAELRQLPLAQRAAA